MQSPSATARRAERAPDRRPPALLLLVAHLDIELVPRSRAALDPEAAQYFLGLGHREFSALTIFCPERVIIFNDQHTSVRTSSNLADELAHALLLHAAAPPLTADGGRNWDSAIEREANELAGHLLVSNAAARRCVALGFTVANAAGQYGVSDQMMGWRMGRAAAILLSAALGIATEQSGPLARRASRLLGPRRRLAAFVSGSKADGILQHFHSPGTLNPHTPIGDGPAKPMR
jgi:hypothetical protein